MTVRPCDCGVVPSGVGSHCMIHHVDEPWDESTYIVCGECGHVYQRDEDLRDAWRRELPGTEPPQPAFEIFSCMECGHDF